MLHFEKDKYIIEIPSDFKLKATFRDMDNNTPFKVIFWDNNDNHYVIYNTGKEQKNCVIANDGVYFIFENYPFTNATRLKYTQFTSTPDIDFNDDRLDEQQSYLTPIYLVTRFATSVLKDDETILADIDMPILTIDVLNSLGDSETQAMSQKITTQELNSKVKALIINNEEYTPIDGVVTIDASFGGVDDYTKLKNLPKINTIELNGDKTSNDLGLANKIHTHTINNIDNLQNELDNKVSKVNGKDLSTNDFTNEAKEKLEGISANAEVNKIDTIKVNNVSLIISNKEVNINVPTKLSELNNDSGFITNVVDDLTNYYNKKNSYNKSEVDNLISNITKVSIEVVDSLPTQGESNVIYLVAKSGSTNDIYDEYIYINDSWEKIGTTAVDLTNYYTKDETNTLLDNEIKSNKIDTLQRFIPIKWKNKSFIDINGNEQTTTDNNVNSSDYILVLPNEIYTTNTELHKGGHIALYDSNKNFVRQLSYTDNYKQIDTTNVSYVRLTHNNNGVNISDVYLDNKNDILKYKIVVDGEFNLDSDNPIQNKVVTKALGDIETILDNINGD